MPRARRLAVVSLLGLTFLCKIPVLAQGPRESVLRVLSWNTFNLPTIAGEMGQINMDEKDRGKLIALILKASPFDVVALNEVFDETVRGALLEEAKSGPQAFRFIVEKLDGGTLEDSGLLLLSRLDPIRFPAKQPIPMVPGDNTSQPSRRCAAQPVWWYTGPGTGSTPSWRAANGGECLIAFHDYEACTYDAVFGAECQSSKGVGYVRLRQRNGLPLDVFWSHMQANAGNFRKARRAQFNELARFVTFWSPKGERDTVLMGDLNVDGSNITGAEYVRTIATSSSSVLGRLGFRDQWPWMVGAPKQDPGLTYSHRNDHVPLDEPEQRLDYVLWRNRDGRKACAQHPKVERNFDLIKPGGSTVDLSDHFGVSLEVRQAAEDPVNNPEPCAPTRATKLSSLPGGVFRENITSSGACQWLSLDPGTYTVTNSTSEPLKISAWYQDDISREMDFFRGDSELLPVRKEDEAQVASDVPFLLKFCWAQYTRKGIFEVRVGPNTGADPLHPVVLSLNRFAKGVYGNQYGANPSNLFWALVQVPPTFSTEPHKMRVALKPGSNVEVRVGRAVPGDANPSITWVSGMMSLAAGIDVPAGGWGGPASVETHVVIERTPPVNPAQGFSFELRAETDHQEVELGVLECKEQEDSTGDDRIRLTYSADGVVKKIIDLGYFDEGQDTNLSSRPDIGRKWVRGNVRITIFDQDGDDLEDDVTSGNALDNLGTDVIDPILGPVPTDAQMESGKLRFTQDGANYELRWKRRR